MTFQIPDKIKTKADYDICQTTNKLIYVLSFANCDGDYVAKGYLTNYFEDSIEVSGQLFKKVSMNSLLLKYKFDKNWTSKHSRLSPVSCLYSCADQRL